MTQPKTWYVVTDGGRARILEKRDQLAGFDTSLSLVSPDLHHRTRELGTDRPGRTYESGNAAHHAQQPREDLHEAEKRRFAGEVAQMLNEASARNEFDRLVLVAPAHALQELEHALNGSTQGKIAGRLQKDLTHLPNAEFEKHFADLKESRSGSARIIP